MKHVMSYIGAWLAAVLLLCAALLSLTLWATTETFMNRALGGNASVMRQQAAIDLQAAQLREAYAVSEATLAPWSDGAAQAHQRALARWWSGLWRGGDAVWPGYLDAAGERELVAALMADEGFRVAHPADQLRTIARDEVAYQLDEAVCRAVLPIRRSVAELALALAPVEAAVLLVRLMPWGIGVLLALAAGLMALLRRAAGSILTATAGLMALVSVPVWLMDLHGILRQLNEIAAVQGDAMLTWLAVPWYGAAAVIAAAGLLLIRREG